MKRFRFLLSSVVPFVLLACSDDSQRPPSEPPASASSSASAPGSGGESGAAASDTAPAKPGSPGIAPASPDVPAPNARPEPLPRPAASGARAQVSGRVDRDSALTGPGSSDAASAGIPLHGQGVARDLTGEAALALPAAPQAGQAAGARLLPRSAGGSAPPGRSALEYVVEKGDTLAKIADAHEIALPELQAWNPGVDSRRLKIGQTIRLAPPIRTAGSDDGPAAPGDAGRAHSPTRSTESQPAPRTATTDASGAASRSEYTVAKGDTMAAIAREQAVRLEDLRAWNPGVDSRRLKIGQKLRLEPPARRAESRS